MKYQTILPRRLVDLVDQIDMDTVNYPSVKYLTCNPSIPERPVISELNPPGTTAETTQLVDNDMQIGPSDGATCVIRDDRHYVTKLLLGLAGGSDFVLGNIAKYIQPQEEK